MNLYQLKSTIMDKQVAGEDCTEEKVTLALHMASLRTDADIEALINDDAARGRLLDDTED